MATAAGEQESDGGRVARQMALQSSVSAGLKGRMKAMVAGMLGDGSGKAR
jgi:hypothetical protein